MSVLRHLGRPYYAAVLWAGLVLSLGGCEHADPLEHDAGSAKVAQDDAGMPGSADAYGTRAQAGHGDDRAAGDTTARRDASVSSVSSGAYDAAVADASTVEDSPDAAPADCIEPTEPPLGFDESCRQFDSFVLENPRITDDGGDGVLSPGENGTITVTWRETQGISASWYPGVKFTSTNTGVTVGENDQRYAALACQAEDLHTSLSVGPYVTLHSRVTLTAHLVVLSDDCPLADSVDVSFAVGDPLP